LGFVDDEHRAAGVFGALCKTVGESATVRTGEEMGHGTGPAPARDRRPAGAETDTINLDIRKILDVTTVD